MTEKRVVAIVGTATSSRADANKEPPTTEIWALLGGYNFLDRVDRQFEIHAPAHLVRNIGAGHIAQYFANLAALDHPVYMQDTHPAIPNSVRYPLEEIVQEFGPYLTSTVAYMTALAIYEGVDEIHVYGIDMHNWMEYADQRACFEYYLGIARGRGIKVVLPANCPLLKAPIYGHKTEGMVVAGDLANRERELMQAEAEARDMMIEAKARRDEVGKIKRMIENTTQLQDLMDSTQHDFVAPKGYVNGAQAKANSRA